MLEVNKALCENHNKLYGGKNMFSEPEKNDHGLGRAPFKSCVVPRAIGWLSTISEDGVSNLAPYSQFTNLSFDPPYVLVAINQTFDGLRKDTTNNIESTGEFVYNMVTYELREKMNVSSCRFPPEVDEFEMSGLTKAESVLVRPYRVAESPIQLECRHYSTIRLPGNGKVGPTDVIIGKVVGVHVKDEFIMPDGKLDMEKIRPLARMGYSDYTVVDKVFEMKHIAMDNEMEIKDKSTMHLGLEGQAGVFNK